MSPELSDEQHIFVECPGAAEIRNDSVRRAIAKVDGLFKYIDDLGSEEHKCHLELAQAIFVDGDMWIGKKSHFWMGAMPGNFDYRSKHRGLYNDLAGVQIAGTAKIWAMHTRLT